MNYLICQNEERREAVRRQSTLYGLDYLSVGDDQRTLTARFLGKAPSGLNAQNVLIDGGRRIRDIHVVSAETEFSNDPELDDSLKVVVDRAGDFSTYTLSIVERDARGLPHPHHQFDPRYDSVDFNFKVNCPTDLDCKTLPQCPPVERVEPEIDYLAKDYESFRQLIFDRLAPVMPDWQERHVPDIGVALVEALAYAGDYLSYYQDAVATEAYLDTARQRISVRRHARLVDYQISEGCNARAWVVIEAAGDIQLDPRDIYFITSFDQAMNLSVTPTEEELKKLPSGGYEIFEPMTGGAIQIYESHSEISFYAWGDDECCLDRGATSATLIGELAPAPQSAPVVEQPVPQKAEQNKIPQLHLQAGDVLIFEEVIGPKTGNAADADPARRHAVRLTSVEAATDPLNNQPIVDIEWAQEDALPFPICLSTLGPPPNCAIIQDVSVARGNAILVDHGQTIEEDLEAVQAKTIVEKCEGEGELADVSITPKRYRPKLKETPLTFSEPLEASVPASRSLQQDVRKALPQVSLTGDPAPSGDPAWIAQSDLIESSSGDQHFVAEIDNDGRAHLRFGDGELGRRPEAGMKFHAVYRAGEGAAGNVGAEAISRLVTRKNALSGVVAAVRNPLPAAGGAAPEPLAEVKLFAPHAFRQELRRAIIADDYAAIAQRDFSGVVQRAAATLRWNGSWYEAVVAVDQFGAERADSSLLHEIEKDLFRYRRMGHEVRVETARLVPLDIAMTVCVRPNYLRGHVKAALLDLFSARVLPDGSKGFFHPDNLSFGDGIYLSKLVALAQAVTGVESVIVTKLERLFEGPAGEIESGVLQLGPLEVAELENDPSFPEHGKFTLTVGGGR
ncbi:MAG: putative baseplate assembly protein [Chloracidobacterium sp.]|nr:putative baseplate assembly protein [Chloracidobacterium sp.]